jgi:hypothetical protein
MDEDLKKILERICTAIEDGNKNGEKIEKLTVENAFQKNKNEQVEDAITHFEKFASQAVQRINQMNIIIDAISVCLFEGNIIQHEKLQSVMTQLINQQSKPEQEIAQEVTNETNREEDSTRTAE